MQQYDVIVIGGGAAGLMCAITAGCRGRRVLLIEHTNRVGKKILMSGGGRCNFTNLHIEPGCYLSANPHFCKSALKQYTQWDFIALVERHGLAYHEKKSGQLFCDHSSKDIVNILLAECAAASVTIKTGCAVQAISRHSQFTVETAIGAYASESLVVATGGLSIPKMGASGFAYAVARQFALSVLPVRAALVPFIFGDAFKSLSERLSGVSVSVLARHARQQFAGDILFTHRGLSGPAILQLSSYWREGEWIELDLLPDVDAEDCLKNFKREHPSALLRNLLSQQLPRRLVLELEALWWQEKADIPLQGWTDQMLSALALRLKTWRLKPSGTEGYRTAEVTLGGIDTQALSSRTMESNTQPGLYFIGEAVDVTGHLGGFNFQWAWSSGYAAGQVV